MSGDTALASALRRDRVVVLAAMLTIAVLAWTWLLRESARMAALDMPGMEDMPMSHMQMMSPALAPWTATLALYLLAMWFVMMVGMMTPTVAPAVLIYIGVARQAGARGQHFASAAWFFGGYVSAWAAFALLATIAQWWLESSALMTAAMQTRSRTLGAAVLIAAGIYQWLPAKHACLSRCRSPLSFILQHGGFQAGVRGSVRLGFLHGLYCVGCCWTLMLLLFVGGVMNPLWIATLMAFVLTEKLAPGARWFTRAAGLFAITAGLWMLR